VTAGALVLYVLAGALMGALACLVVASKLVRAVSSREEVAFRHAARANAWTDVAESMDSLARDEKARGNLGVAVSLDAHASWAWQKAKLQAAMADAAARESSQRGRRGPPPGSEEQPPSPTDRA